MNKPTNTRNPSMLRSKRTSIMPPTESKPKTRSSALPTPISRNGLTDQLTELPNPTSLRRRRPWIDAPQPAPHTPKEP